MFQKLKSIGMDFFFLFSRIIKNKSNTNTPLQVKHAADIDKIVDNGRFSIGRNIFLLIFENPDVKHVFFFTQPSK